MKLCITNTKVHITKTKVLKILSKRQISVYIIRVVSAVYLQFLHANSPSYTCSFVYFETTDAADIADEPASFSTTWRHIVFPLRAEWCVRACELELRQILQWCRINVGFCALCARACCERDDDDDERRVTGPTAWHVHTALVWWASYCAHVLHAVWGGALTTAAIRLYVCSMLLYSA